MTDAQPVIVEYDSESFNTPTRPTDDKGRPQPANMSDRELLVELVFTMRTVGDALDELSKSPMIQAMQNGAGLMGMMRA